ncbi:MAG: transposase, partial [Acidobacteria bacterium]|nr:transposase [Acidobacteriota bacterium]
SRHWVRLRRVLDYPELELSTNLAENSMRGIAIGRKTWIHVGSPVAGPKVAAILSVIESCRRPRVPVREYLLDVLPGLGRVNIRDLDWRTPSGWMRRQAIG